MEERLQGAGEGQLPRASCPPQAVQRKEKHGFLGGNTGRHRLLQLSFLRGVKLVTEKEPGGDGMQAEGLLKAFTESRVTRCLCYLFTIIVISEESTDDSKKFTG